MNRYNSVSVYLKIIRHYYNEFMTKAMCSPTGENKILLGGQLVPVFYGDTVNDIVLRVVCHDKAHHDDWVRKCAILPTFKNKNPDYWKEFVQKWDDNPRVIYFIANWLHNMEKQMFLGSRLSSVMLSSSRLQSGFDTLSGYEDGVTAGVISTVWKHGEAFTQAYNAIYGVRGCSAPINPGVLVFSKI